VLALQRYRPRPAKIERAIAKALLGIAAGLAFLHGGHSASGQVPQSQGVPAAAPVTSGQNPAQTSVPQAATAPQTSPAAQQPKPEPPLPPLAASLFQYAGRTVNAIRYEGVEFALSDKLLSQLTQKAGEPLDPEKVRQTTRRLFATGRYLNIGVRVENTASGVDLIFSGIPRFYVGQVQIFGVKDSRLTSLLEYGTKLNPGVAYNDGDAQAGADAVKLVLAQNGYYQPTVSFKTTPDPAGQQINVAYTVAIGPQARVGKVTIAGKDPGITLEAFRKKGKLKANSKVGHETTSTTLDNLRKYFQKKDHLEATVTLRKSTYVPATKTIDYDFDVEQGPIVRVEVAGAHFSKSRLHLLVPVFEEGTVDNDLLNEGTYNMKDFLQQQGFFDAVVKVSVQQPAPDQQVVLYSVDKGEDHKVVSVEIAGNKYFSSDLLKENLKIQKADAYQRNGRYSQELLNADEKNLEALYRANGFSQAKVTATVSDVDTKPNGQPSKVAGISVTFRVQEGAQQKFGEVALNGVDADKTAALKGLLQSAPGQPFSLITLSGDRDAILGYYLSNGFDQARVEVAQTPDPADKTRTDIGFNVTQGPQVFIGKVLESGIHYTRPTVVDQQLRVHPGDPLDQSALLETQRNLYNLALFNEVNADVQNPTGDAQQKNVLVQVQEAKRWDVTYGFGFEAQTGLPACNYCTQQGTTAAQEGKAGVSPRVSLDVTRINVRGKDNSLTLHTTYGLLETVATLTFQNPHLYGSQKLSAQVSGGYSNVQDITTFASSKISFDFRITQKLNRKDTFIYDFEYRRVAVNPDSLAISASLIPLLSEPVRVGGPGITWFHDTRSPNPLDAHKGSYTSVQDFYASSKFGSQTDFNRTDVSNSTYYVFGKKKYVFARDTRLGFIASFGANPNVTNPACAGILLDTNASCNAVPLPERLYAGGATSLRGFPINGAGPRDLQTGYPVGGSGVFVNSFELRMPPPVLPWVGDSVSFVLFHDMGNVFQHVGDIFPSFARIHQPDAPTCQVVTNVTIGTCDFNYFSHAVGIGARYRTPVGPIRFDLSYNLNPPTYPVITQQTAPGVYVNNILPYVGQASHFNFFFSIGQTF
jgi:outer membrane protein assembly complex protein YaeT